MHRNEHEGTLHGPTRFVLVALTLAGLVTATACGGAEAPAPEPEPAAEEPAAEEPMDASPRVYFISPVEGSTVTSPVHLMFGAENFVIEPVGEGEIHEGAGHHHVGIDTDCLPAGEIIPEAEPWVHFGDASAMIDMQFEAGEHRVCLQIGDGEHRTLEGLSAMVTFTVE
jgi:hypothetical protein